MKSDVVLPEPTSSTPAQQANTHANVVEQPRPLSPKRVEGQRFVSATDLAGTWALVSSTYAGRGRGGTGGGVEREVKVSIASGAPVNCGTECTIVQNPKTLTTVSMPPVQRHPTSAWLC